MQAGNSRSTVKCGDAGCCAGASCEYFNPPWPFPYYYGALAMWDIYWKNGDTWHQVCPSTVALQETFNSDKIDFLSVQPNSNCLR